MSRRIHATSVFSVRRRSWRARIASRTRSRRRGVSGVTWRVPRTGNDPARASATAAHDIALSARSASITRLPPPRRAQYPTRRAGVNAVPRRDGSVHWLSGRKHARSARPSPPGGQGAVLVAGAGDRAARRVRERIRAVTFRALITAIVRRLGRPRGRQRIGSRPPWLGGRRPRSRSGSDGPRAGAPTKGRRSPGAPAGAHRRGPYVGWMRASGTSTRLTPLKLKSSSTR